MYYCCCTVLLSFRSIVVLGAVFASLFARVCDAATEVVALSGERFVAELTSIDAEGRVHFGPSRLLTIGDVIRWGHPVETRPQPIVLLDDGSRLVSAAAWAGAAPVALSGDEFMVTSDLVKDMRLARRQVVGVIFAERNHPAQRRALEESIRVSEAAGRDQDEVLLTNNDRIRGKIAAIGDGMLIVAAAAGEAKLPLSRIQSVALAHLQATDPLSREKLQVALRDGSVLRANSVIADDKTLKIQIAALSLTLEGANVGDIVALQSMTGERLAYLSDLNPASFRHVPYLSIEWPYKRDRNVRGDILVVGRNRYLKGVGMHSAGRLTYSLDAAAGWRRFETSIAVDDSTDGRGSVTFSVYVQRGGQWQSAYTSGIVRGGEKPIDVSIDVSGATGLTLTADYAERGDELDHADWLDSRLVK
jgi:hypothetical protein